MNYTLWVGGGRLFYSHRFFLNYKSCEEFSLFENIPLKYFFCLNSPCYGDHYFRILKVLEENLPPTLIIYSTKHFVSMYGDLNKSPFHTSFHPGSAHTCCLQNKPQILQCLHQVRPADNSWPRGLSLHCFSLALLV